MRIAPEVRRAPRMGEAVMRRVSEFDALRGLAALGVLLFHLQDRFGTWTHFGFTGVHLFLILSGYLITGIILRHIDSPGFFRAFYARRILRIWPIYYLTIGFLVIFQRYHYFNPPSLSGLPYYLSFTQFLWSYPVLGGILPHPRGTTIHAFEHSWTLAIEEQFYLLWPLVIVLCGRRMIVPLIVAICTVGVWFKTIPSTDPYFSWVLPYVAGAFAMGGLIAVILNNRERAQRCRGVLSLGFLASSALGLAYLRWYYTCPPPEWLGMHAIYWHSVQNFAFYTVHFGLVGFVATNAGAWFLAPLRTKELTFLGEISYGMYLYHLPIYWLVNNSGTHDSTNDPWSMWVCKIAITIAVATLSYRYIEMPILRLKDFFPYEGRTPSVAVTTDTPTPRKVDAPALTAIRQPRMVYARPTSLDRDEAETR